MEAGEVKEVTFNLDIATVVVVVAVVVVVVAVVAVLALVAFLGPMLSVLLQIGSRRLLARKSDNAWRRRNLGMRDYQNEIEQ